MKAHQLTTTTLAMRTLLLVQSMYLRAPAFLMGSAVAEVMRAFGASRPTAWRYVREAVDVLAIPYDDDPDRVAARAAIRAAAQHSARVARRSRVLTGPGTPAGDGGLGGHLASDS